MANASQWSPSRPRSRFNNSALSLGLSTRAGTRGSLVPHANPSGSAYFRVTDPGVWRVEFHYAQPSQDDQAADWTVYNATLTFEVPKGGAQ